MRDFKNMEGTVYHTAEKIEDIDQDNTIQYTILRQKFMSDRDAVVRTQHIDLPRDRHLLVDKTVDSEAIPKKDGIIRIQFEKYSAVWNEGSDLHITTFDHINLGGNFSPMLVN